MFTLYWNIFLFSLVVMSIFWNMLILDVFSNWMGQTWRFVQWLCNCLSVIGNFWSFVIIALILFLMLQKLDLNTELVICELSFCILFVEWKNFFILLTTKITFIDQNLQLMRIFVFNIEIFQIFFPMFCIIGNRCHILWQLIFTYWQSGDFLFCFENFILQFIELKVWIFLFVLWKMEFKLALWRYIWSNISTAGSVIFIDKFHESFVTFLVHDKIFLHFFLDFVEDYIFGKQEILLFHVFVYFQRITLFTFISGRHTMGPDLDNSQKLYIKLFFLLFWGQNFGINVFALLWPTFPLNFKDLFRNFPNEICRID